MTEHGRETRKQNAHTHKKNSSNEKSKLYFIYNMDIPGLTLPIVLNSRKKSGRQQGVSGAVSGAGRCGSPRHNIPQPSLVLISQPVWKPFAISFCFSPCCLGSSWAKGAGKIRGIRKASHSGTQKRDVLVQREAWEDVSSAAGLLNGLQEQNSPPCSLPPQEGSHLSVIAPCGARPCGVTAPGF